ncbi:unnamed protein product [Mytilus coruscus]|nr:unnamed protein product [Mytilus coruscus]
MRTTKNGGECVVVRVFGKPKHPIAGKSFRPAPFWKFLHDITPANILEFLKNFKSVRIDSGYFSEDLTSGSGTKDDEEFLEKQQWFLDVSKDLAI